MTIDMKSYAGEIESPAAVEQQELNQYQREAQDEAFPTPPDMPPVNALESEQKVAQEVQQDVQEMNFRALSESVEKLKAERESEKREYQLQLDMLRANLARSQQTETPKQKDMFQGMEDSDIPTVGELRKAWSEREAAYNEKIEEINVQQRFPDYAEVLNKYGKQLAETDPIFLQGIRSAENKALFAYQYAKREQEIQDLRSAVNAAKAAPQAAPQVNANAQRIVENARKPGTLAQAGGQSVLSKADYYETMSDSEFMKIAERHLSSI